MKKPVPFGKYYLLERINVGGMAEVFRAKSFGVEGFERLVAVKRILPNIAEDRDFIKMFIDEAKIAVQLNHANIAQIFDLGVVDNAYYIALEHIHGRDLRAIFDRCRQNGEPMSIAQACFVVMKLCEGLDYAHNKRDQNNREIGLVHRDVSPQNVLVSFEGEVKVIDFGIAKAADKSAKTQAGILKGKFGYMSPEQVRGLPIDRRSDIFSCGIVLYELLTGERLFVGESDFSTLEKVRNVEILPPSTYNRKVPDELERIVLKALAKDTEDRYSNAIDLHDELQAFVYTASEFYSRKDLAAWMKKTFAKEIEEESAKLESYRQLKPPASTDARTPAPERRPTQAPPPRRATAAMAVVPPPSPGQGSTQPPPLRTTGPQPIQGRATMAVQAVPAPPRPTSAPVLAKGAGGATAEDSGLSWDDDELETQIYDNPEEEAAARAAKAAGRKPGNGAAAGQVAAALAAVSHAPPKDEPDLSSLVSTAKGWDAPKLPPASSGPSAPTLLNAPAPVLPVPPSNGNGHHLAAGSSKSASPFGDLFQPAASSSPADRLGGAPQTRESSAVMKLVDASEPIFDAMSSFGANVAPPNRSKKMGTGTIVGIAAAVLVVGGLVALYLSMNGNKKGDKTGSSSDLAAQGTATGSATDVAAAGTGTATASGTASAVAVGTASGTAQPATAGGAPAGFDLYVTPANVVAWRLDGEPKTTSLPARINTLPPGKHTVAIDAPPGFMSESREIDLAPGEMQKVEITLSAIEISGVFDSEPAGAKVTLVTGNQRIDAGVTPTTYKLDPAQRYEVVFEKEGYVSVSKPVTISGQPEEKINAVLDQAHVAAVQPHGGGGTHGNHVKPDGGGGGTKPDGGGGTKPDGGDGGGTKPDGGGTKPDAGEGVLSLGSKPPCDIYIDGKSTGLKTPQREIKLSAGHHKVTLMNNEFGIKESFGVDISAGAVTKQVKDFSDRLASPP